MSEVKTSSYLTLSVDQNNPCAKHHAVDNYRQILEASGEFDPYEIDAMVNAFRQRLPQMPDGWMPPLYEGKH